MDFAQLSKAAVSASTFDKTLSKQYFKQEGAQKILTISLAFGALLTALSSQALAADVVTLQCRIFSKGGPMNVVDASQASAGVTLPQACNSNSPCSQFIADLMSNNF